LTDQIAQVFDALIFKRGFSKDIIKITNVIYELLYSKDNIHVLIDVEEMESYFYFKIKLDLEQQYLFSDVPCLNEEFNEYKKTAYFKSIFDFTNGAINEKDFKIQKSNLYKKSRSPFIGKKSLDSLIYLYKELLESSLDNIIKFEKELNSSN
jgi:hypothetical protein